MIVIIKEIIDGINIADYVDAEIESRLEGKLFSYQLS